MMTLGVAAGLRVRTAKLAAVAAVGLVLSSCDDEKPSGPKVEFVVTHIDQLEHQGSAPPDLPPEPAFVQGGTALVDAHGLIAAPDACDDLGAQIEAEGELLTLRVIVRGSRLHPGGCGAPGRYALFQWRAGIEPLDPGPLRLRVMYDYRGLRSHFSGDTAGRRDPYPDRVVAEQTVTVR